MKVVWYDNSSSLEVITIVRTIVYADTGEIVEKKEGFFMVSTRNNFLLDKRLTLTDVRVFGYCCNIMLKDGCVIDSQARIAKRLGLTASNLSRSLKHLRSLDYIIDGQYRGRKFPRVNPTYASKRSSNAWKAENLCMEEPPDYQ